MSAPDAVLESLPPLAPRENVPCINLRGAMLCLGCDWLYPGTVTTCPRCGSLHRFPVERVLEPASAQHLLDNTALRGTATEESNS